MASAATKLLSQLRLPVIGAPLFIVSNPKLVVAQCAAGIVGSFPALNARPQEKLDEWLREIKLQLADRDGAAPFAVNQIVHRSNDRLMRDMELIVKHEVPLVITSLGAREDVNEAVHSYGGMVLHDVISNKFARKAIEKGADGVVAVAAGAGGHAGTTSPFALIQEIREWFDGPVALSGSIASGRAVLAAQAAGADLAYIGSAFIACDEANASDAYKQAIADGSSSDIVYSNLFTGIHGNCNAAPAAPARRSIARSPGRPLPWPCLPPAPSRPQLSPASAVLAPPDLRPSIVAAGLDPDNLPSSDPSAMKFGSDQDAATAKKAWRDVWGCGQGIGAVRSVGSTAEYVDRLAGEYEIASSSLDRERARFSGSSKR